MGGDAGVAVTGMVFFGMLSSQTSEVAPRQAFVSATEAALWYEAATFLLTFLLVPLLPRWLQAHEPA